MADYRAEARKAAKRYGLDPNVFQRQIQQESGFNPTIRSPAGAVGIAQIMPGTAKGWGVDPLDPIASLNAAAKNMASYVKKYGGYENALRAYNAGEGAIQASHGYAETNNYVKTILGGRDPGKLASPTKGSGSTPVAAPGSSGSSQAAAPVLGDPGQAPDVTSLLSSLLSQPAAARQAVQVARPGFAASPALPGGVQLAAPQTQQGPQQAGGVDDALSLLGSLRGTDPAVADPVAAGADSVAQEPVAVTVRKQRAAMKAAGFPTNRAYPVGTIGKVIGTPYSGTHTLGNWQSDNAVDIGVKAGTPMLALQDGVVVKVTKHPQGAGRFAGDQITIRGANGNEYFYGHGVANVKAGQKVQRGESLGVTGSANGVEHLHFGQMRGDPRSHTIT